MWKVNEDGISITDPSGKVYVAGDEITRSDGTIIMVKSDWQGITEEDLRKYVPDARSWNGVIVASLNIKGEDVTQEQVDQAIENATTLPLNADDFIIEDDVKVNWSRSNSDQAFQKNDVGRWSFQGDSFLIMANQQIASLATPTAAMDAANKQYVDTEISGQEFKTINGEVITGTGNISAGDGSLWEEVPLGGAEMDLRPVNQGSLLNLYNVDVYRTMRISSSDGGRLIVDGEPTRDTDATNKKYVDDQTTFKESTSENPLKVTDVSIQGVIDGTESWVIPTGQRIDTALNQITEQILWETEEDNETTFLKKPAHINMLGYTLINLDTPVNIAEAATKGYVDQEINKINAFERATNDEGVRYFVAGQPDIDIYSMGGHNLEDLGTPVKDDDAVTKKYVDEQITAVHDYVDSSIQLMTDFFQAQITQIHDAVYSQYMAFDINSNQRWTFADYDTNYWYMLYITVRLTGNRLVTGLIEIPANTISNTEVCNVISDTVSGSSNNLRFLNGVVWVDNWQNEPIYITTIRIMRRKELVA